VGQRWRSVARVLQALVVVGVLGVSVFYLWTSIDRARLVATMLGARPLPLALAVAMVVPAALSRSLYWRAILMPAKAVRFRMLVGYTVACNATNVLLPARAGDALRAWMLKTRHGVPLVISGAAVGLEKVGDLLALSLLVAPLPWLLPNLPAVASHALQVLFAIVVVVAIGLAVGSRYAPRIGWLSGFRALGRPASLLRGFGAIALCWIIDLASMLLVMSAVGFTPRLETALLVLLFVNLATAIPASPGQLGTHEIASAAAMRMQGALPEQAVAFALLYHFAQLVPVLLLGLVDARTTLLWRRRVASESRLSSPAKTRDPIELSTAAESNL
jgi:uncharacterized membrane protein YbhN (UPF0104 family)